MQVIPVNAVPNQTLQVNLGGQSVGLNIYQTKNYGLFMDVACPTMLAPLYGVLCLNAKRIIIDAYWNFTGDLAWFDSEGNDAPEYTGLGSRWFLSWLQPGDYS